MMQFKAGRRSYGNAPVRARSAATEARSLHIAYLVHDLSDPAVARRVAMFETGGATVSVAGFSRVAESAAPKSQDLAPESQTPSRGPRTLSLGRTHDARFAQRAMMVLRSRTRAAGIAGRLGPVDAIVARNLEMLAVATAVRSALPRPVPLTYEVLDVHRLLLRGDAAGSVLRGMEGRLARSASLLVTSSPAFVSSYFVPRSKVRLPTMLVENRALDWLLPPAGPGRVAGPPWRIGLFGALRCRRSVEILSELARREDGRVEIVIRGRPSPAVFPDLAAELAAAPHVRFEGPYRNPDDLAAIYGDVHFTWAIDYFEAGANSAWLLPNRVYEGGAFGSVPLALDGTETAAFLRRHDYGVVFSADIAAALGAFFDDLDPRRYATEVARSTAVPREAFVASQADCAALVRAIAGDPDAALGQMELAA